MTPRVGRSAIIAVAALAAACAARGPANVPLEVSPTGVDPAPTVESHRSQDILLGLAFSGGGTRAAALAFGVLEELAATTVEIDGRPGTLLDQVDVVSSVSGGSFTAAYFGLHGQGALDDFREVFLTRNIQGGLIGRLLLPRDCFRMARRGFGRADLSAEYYDDNVFRGATLGDFDPAGPEIVINATAIHTGYPFRFSPAAFQSLCSDRSAYPVSLAVTASSAVPGAFTPVVLQNFSERCEHPDERAWIEETLAAEQGITLKGDLARSMASLLDPGRRPFVHLVDGGVSDNLGLRGLLERRYRFESAVEQMRRYQGRGFERGLLIVVNATPTRDENFDAESSPPSSVAVLGAANRTMMRRFNRDSVHLARQTLAGIAAELSTAERPVQFELAELKFCDRAHTFKRSGGAERRRRRLLRLPVHLDAI